MNNLLEMFATFSFIVVIYGHIVILWAIITNTLKDFTVLRNVCLWSRPTLFIVFLISLIFLILVVLGKVN